MITLSGRVKSTMSTYDDEFWASMPGSPATEAATEAAPESLGEAIQHLQAHLDEGVKCPCCGQFAKRYKRSLYKGYIQWLIWLIQVTGKGAEWADVRNTPPHLARNGDYAKLQWWGFVESQGKRSRMWKPTREGFWFVQGKIRVPKYAFVYDNVVEGYSPETVSVVEALGERGFDYERDVMAHTVGFGESLPASNVQYSTLGRTV